MHDLEAVDKTDNRSRRLLGVHRDVDHSAILAAPLPSNAMPITGATFRPALRATMS